MAYPHFDVFAPRSTHDHGPIVPDTAPRLSRAIAFTVVVGMSLGLWWSIWALLSALASAWM
jgi:hypothetical protein